MTLGAALLERSSRALLEVTGKDRVTWTHNLTTNQVKTLGRDEGNYAFALNVQGRILFDLNLVVRAEAVWFDLDRRFLEAAMKHLQKYIIMEDVSLRDRTGDFARFALAGPWAKEILAALGASQAVAMPAASMTSVSYKQAQIQLMRNDFCGVFAVDMFAPQELGPTLRADLCGPQRPKPALAIGGEAAEIRRVEAGIPWPGAEITDDFLPAETRQLERAVSFQKGCYLGQEIVERMRARKVVSRVLCGLKLEGEAVPRPGAQVLTEDGAGVGTITSSCRSAALEASIALGYIKSAVATPGAAVQVRWDQSSAQATVATLPFVAAAAG